MRIVLVVAAAIVLMNVFFKIFIAPFFIGKDLGKYEPSNYVMGLGLSAVYILLVGRVLGWW